MTAWCIGIASWFLAIVESIGMWRFWPWVFGTGVRVWTENSSLPLQTMGIGSEIETESGKFKVVSPDLCLFRWRMRWFSFNIHTPFPIKGSLRWDGYRTIIEGRIPLFPILFFAAWLIGWTSGGVMVGLQSGISFDNVCSTLLGLAFVAGMFGFSIPLEMRRAREVLSEYEYYVEDRT